jgi:hypothetical protein
MVDGGDSSGGVGRFGPPFGGYVGGQRRSIVQVFQHTLRHTLMNNPTTRGMQMPYNAIALRVHKLTTKLQHFFE